MKFAHEFQEALLKEGFPATWVESAVPYGPLKKVIKKVLKELKQIGFHPSQLADGVAFKYGFDGHGDEVFKPKLTLYFEGDQPVDATLSAGTRDFLERLAANRKEHKSDSEPTPNVITNSSGPSERSGSIIAEDPLAKPLPND